tara:strand:- start:3782 stop:4279 length:498 start_codon:yes stop_codon:yes gene_type:complete
MESRAYNQKPKAGYKDARLFRYTGTDLYQWFAKKTDSVFEDAFNEPVLIKPRLAATPPAQGEAVPFTYAHRYPVANGETVIRFGTNGREINGSRPIEAIALYTAPPPVTGEGVRDAIRKHVWEAVLAASVEVPDKFEARTAMRMTITENATADILAALTPAGGEG